MPIQTKCKNCKRLGGYTPDVESGLCGRCLNLKSVNTERDEKGKFKKGEGEE